MPHGIKDALRARRDDETISQVRRKYAINGDYILSINDIHPRKNLVGLVRAYDIARQASGFAHQLVLVGRTLWNYPEFSAAIEQSPYRRDIVLPGYVAATDIAALYQGATLFVYPSFYEGWGLQVHEAMCAGTPVAVANNSTMPEIAGGAAAEFDPYDLDDMAQCMRRVIEDANLRAAMVAHGLEQVQRYSWASAARQTLEICHELG